MVWNKGLKNDPRLKGGRPKSSLSYVGQTYGRLTILEQYSTEKHIKFKCKCECGNLTDVRKDNLITKADTVSCGCRLQELHQERREMGDRSGPTDAERNRYNAAVTKNNTVGDKSVEPSPRAVNQRANQKGHSGLMPTRVNQNSTEYVKPNQSWRGY
jgi:hypothetical protein